MLGRRPFSFTASWTKEPKARCLRRPVVRWARLEHFFILLHRFLCSLYCSHALLSHVFVFPPLSLSLSLSISLSLLLFLSLMVFLLLASTPPLLLSHTFRPSRCVCTAIKAGPHCSPPKRCCLYHGISQTHCLLVVCTRKCVVCFCAVLMLTHNYLVPMVSPVGCCSQGHVYCVMSSIRKVRRGIVIKSSTLHPLTWLQNKHRLSEIQSNAVDEVNVFK